MLTLFKVQASSCKEQYFQSKKIHFILVDISTRLPILELSHLYLSDSDDKIPLSSIFFLPRSNNILQSVTMKTSWQVTTENTLFQKQLSQGQTMIADKFKLWLQGESGSWCWTEETVTAYWNLRICHNLVALLYSNTKILVYAHVRGEENTKYKQNK